MEAVEQEIKPPEQCWICGVDMPSMKVRAALKQDPTFMDGHTHFGSLSRFDNESHCCDECGQVEAMWHILAPLTDEWKSWIGHRLTEAQQTKDRDMWKAGICMARGALLGHHERSHDAFEKMLEKMS